MADHLSRKNLKTDQAAVAVGHTVDYFAAHRQQVIRVAIGAAVLLVLIAGIVFFRNQRHAARQQALGEALLIANAPVGTAPPNGGLSYPSESAKQDAEQKGFSRVVNDWGGSDEAYIAEYYLAGLDVDSGKSDSAKKRYQDVADHASKNYASLGKLSLAQLYAQENRNGDAEKLLKDLMDNPTDLVSKDQSTIAYARVIGRTRAAEARKLLDPLATKSSDISPIAIQALAEIPAK